jgi:hypothetical protein
LNFPAGKSAPATISPRVLFELSDAQDAPFWEFICALANTDGPDLGRGGDSPFVKIAFVCRVLQRPGRQSSRRKTVISYSLNGIFHMPRIRLDNSHHYREPRSMKNLTLPAITLATVISSVAAVPALGQTAAAPYQLSVFATAPKGLSAPDSIAVLRDHVFVGYGDGNLPDGSDGKSTQIVDYAMDGSIRYTYTVKGHSDGLKVDPSSHLLWAIQNEDANANLVIINPESHEQKLYTFGPTLHGGGYDDLVFRDCKVYISASNPANNPNTGPAIVSASLEGSFVDVQPVLAGEASAIDIPTDATVKLNLQDPDSMTLDPQGNIVLDSQGDQELIIVSNPGSSTQRVVHLPLSFETASGPMPVEVDDTAFVTSTEGFILFADKGLSKVFALKKNAFVPGAAYTAADGGPFVGTIDLTSGVITPIVTGLSGPGGLVFVDTGKRHADLLQEDGSSCRNRGWESH